MKTFIEICQMTQSELKEYLHRYLISKKYTVINENGFLLGKPSKDKVPVLLTAHMDTVHSETIKTVEKLKVAVGNDIYTKYSSPQGIGGDDRCGIYMIMNILNESSPYVLFCEDEERGCIGAGKFILTRHAKELKDKINYIIELDRRGKSDAVFYSCDNRDFVKWIEENSKYKEAYGSCSDISTLMPSMGVAGVNFSCGYYSEHTKVEYVYYEQMLNTIQMVSELIKIKVDEPFKYVAKKYATYNGLRSLNSWYDDDDYFQRYYKNGGYLSTEKKKQNHIVAPTASDYEVELTVWLDTDVALIAGIDDEELVANGSTKPECWMNLFMENPSLSFDMISDYEYI